MIYCDLTLCIFCLQNNAIPLIQIIEVFDLIQITVKNKPFLEWENCVGMGKTHTSWKSHFGRNKLCKRFLTWVGKTVDVTQSGHFRRQRLSQHLERHYTYINDNFSKRIKICGNKIFQQVSKSLYFCFVRSLFLFDRFEPMFVPKISGFDQWAVEPLR